MVQHRLLEAVVVAQRVEGVRVGGDHAPELALAERLEVLVAQDLEEALLADAPHLVARVDLVLAQRADVLAGRREHAAEGRADLLDARIEGRARCR